MKQISGYNSKLTASLVNGTLLKDSIFMRQFAYLVILGQFFLCCTHKNVKKSESIELDSLKREELKITIINDSAQVKYIADSFVLFWIPTQNQLDLIDSIGKQAIKENGKDYYRHLKPDSLKHYYRQYICYTDSNGDSIAFINAFLKNIFLPLPGDIRKIDDWQYYLIEVNDGGENYWRIFINITKKRYYNFNVNGEA